MNDMTLRYLICGGAVVLGALLGLFLRVKTIVIGLVVILCFAVLGIFLAYGSGDEELGFLFGVASMAIAFLGTIVAVAATVVQAVFTR